MPLCQQEPTTPCTINTSSKKELFREPMTDGQRKLGDQNISEGANGSTSNSTSSGTSGITSRYTSGSSSPNNSTQIIVPHVACIAHS
jgi:hypothetical protein